MKFANEAVTGRRRAVCVGWEAAAEVVGRSVGLAESASADSQKPSDVERGGGGGDGGCANLERLPARLRQHQCPVPPFCKTAAAAVPPRTLSCIWGSSFFSHSTYYQSQIVRDMYLAKFADLPRDKFEL